MQNGICVGGIVESTNELIRLHDDRGGNLPIDSPYEVGDRWDIAIQHAWNARPIPHIEDKQTLPIRKIENIGIHGIIQFLMSKNLGARLTRGPLSQTFEGCLNLCGKKNFVDRNHIPSFSTQFWIPDTNLIHRIEWGKHYYYYNDIRLKFVGFQTDIDIIPAGAIVRLSLANWWDGDDSGEERCYLQLSGWYLQK